MICVLGNLLTNVVSYVIGILLLVIGGSAIYCIVKALWQSLLILVVLGIATIAAVFLLVWAVMKVENIGESLGASGHKIISEKSHRPVAFSFGKEVMGMAATRLIALHVNKGKTVAQCLADRTDYSQNAAASLSITVSENFVSMEFKIIFPLLSFTDGASSALSSDGVT